MCRIRKTSEDLLPIIDKFLNTITKMADERPRCRKNIRPVQDTIPAEVFEDDPTKRDPCENTESTVSEYEEKDHLDETDDQQSSEGEQDDSEEEDDEEVLRVSLGDIYFLHLVSSSSPNTVPLEIIFFCSVPYRKSFTTKATEFHQS